MKSVSELSQAPDFVLTDIDDTLTEHGQLHADAYSALWKLKNAGVKIIPVTGRPAGWCEMIARFWPVDGVIGENGGLYFRYFQKEMRRAFFANETEIRENRKKLNQIQEQILTEVPGAQVASDQFCRVLDLAIDYCEDVTPLSQDAVKKIVQIFESHGAQAKVSSIHVNGWFGQYDKVTMLRQLLRTEFGLNDDQIKKSCLFSGDSPNDEPMFQFFPQSVGVANIKAYLAQLKNPPAFVTPSPGGRGFVELTQKILSLKR